METNQLDHIEKMILNDFISERWSEFEDVCEPHGLDAELISEKLASD